MPPTPHTHAQASGVYTGNYGGAGAFRESEKSDAPPPRVPPPVPPPAAVGPPPRPGPGGPPTAPPQSNTLAAEPGAGVATANVAASVAPFDANVLGGEAPAPAHADHHARRTRPADNSWMPVPF